MHAKERERERRSVAHSAQDMCSSFRSSMTTSSTRRLRMRTATVRSLTTVRYSSRYHVRITPDSHGLTCSGRGLYQADLGEEGPRRQQRRRAKQVTAGGLVCKKTCAGSNVICWLDLMEIMRRLNKKAKLARAHLLGGR
jgi:hypothetical protein